MEQQTLSNEQVQHAAQVGLQLLDLDTTVAPTRMRNSLGLLEMVLTAVAQGQGVIINPERLQALELAEKELQAVKSAKKDVDLPPEDIPDAV